MTKPKPSNALTIVPGDPRELPLRHGRRLSLAEAGGEDLVEIRGVGGALELRIRLTAEGPVLQLESLRVSLRAAEAIEVDCKNFKLWAREGMELCSDGPVRIHAEGDVQVEAAADVRVSGTLIHLN